MMRLTLALAAVSAAMPAAAHAAPVGRTVLHFGGRPMPVSADGASGRARRLQDGFPPIPNRTSPRELLIGTKTSFPFSFPAGSREDAPSSFVTSADGPKYAGYSWELFDE